MCKQQRQQELAKRRYQLIKYVWASAPDSGKNFQCYYETANAQDKTTTEFETKQSQSGIEQFLISTFNNNSTYLRKRKQRKTIATIQNVSPEEAEKEKAIIKVDCD